MKYPLNNSTGRASAGGFAIVSAIFLIVILAALGVGILVFSRAQQASSAYDVQGSRAYQAARAGIEWAVYQRVAPVNYNLATNPLTLPAFCALTGSTWPPTAWSPGTAALQAGSTMTYLNVPLKDFGGAASQQPFYNLSLGAPTLSQFTVTVTCSATVTAPDVNNLDSYGNPNMIVVRTIIATACNQPVSGTNAACPNPTPGLDYVQRKVQVNLQQQY